MWFLVQVLLIKEPYDQKVLSPLFCKMSGEGQKMMMTATSTCRTLTLCRGPSSCLSVFTHLRLVGCVLLLVPCYKQEDTEAQEG